MKYLITIIILIALVIATHTTFGIYNDNSITSIGAGNRYIGFSVGSDHGRLFTNYHIGVAYTDN